MSSHRGSHKHTRERSAERAINNTSSQAPDGTKVVMERAVPMPHQVYHMDADEAERLQTRASNMTTVKLLTAQTEHTFEGNTHKVDNAHTPHYCYMKLIGSIQHTTDCPDAKKIDSEKCELLLADNLTLYVEAFELVNNRKKYLVFEDNFQSSITQLVHDRGFERLREICARFENATGMEQHNAKSNDTYEYFEKKGMDRENALACAFVLSFYTGSHVYQTVNRSASLIARHGNGEATSLVNTNKFKEAGIIMYYLIKALAHIEFYWGIASRAVDLDAKELDDYKPGNLVSWIQFSSSKKGEEPPENFSSRNTIFTIYSLTGRCIEYFSNFPQEEEVLFPPHSTFLVTRIVRISSTQTKIYMRQIELGLCKHSVMWVDDYIFYDWWENKDYMEKAGTIGMDKNVHFIPKASTESALVFLRCKFGERLKNEPTFRIVTDMTRDKEIQPDNAGARLLAAVRDLGFNNYCLVFTMNEEKAWEKINSLIPASKRHKITVTKDVKILEKFINFVS
ncbi:unnamed protein product [Rotaria magnacalcarata]|uniref:NAD(P)(+)--arginine ADP-ribosyltransferase n=1 Tax=Rotaria magnacalcarata TaxID=392030 RepID=A0A816AAF0_9BILA|nr:unnamed protein product [Rotaria magnacalcarata]